MAHRFGVQDADGIHGAYSYRPLAATACSYCGAAAGAYCAMPDGSQRARVHSARIESWKRSRAQGQWVAELLTSNSALDLHAGDVVLVKSGIQRGRLEILRRLSDGHDPEASVSPDSTRFIRESTEAERKVTARRVLSQSAREDEAAVRLYERGYSRIMATMA